MYKHPNNRDRANRTEAEEKGEKNVIKFEQNRNQNLNNTLENWKSSMTKAKFKVITTKSKS